MLERFISPYDASVVQRLKAHQAIIFGKTNMDEFGMGSSTTESAYGCSLNPWGARFGRDGVLDPGDLSPGGSSGGGAAAVASYLCHGAIGSDTGGSVRQPASFCGVVGLKPSYGVLSRYGLVAYASSLDTPGVMARSVIDSALLLCAAMADNPDPMDPTSTGGCPERILSSLSNSTVRTSDTGAVLESLKISEDSNVSLKGTVIGVPIEFSTAEVDPLVRGVWEETLRMLVDAGAEVRTISLPSLKVALPAYYMLACAEASSNLSRYDGVRYGMRCEGGGWTGGEAGELGAAEELLSQVAKSRGRGFGAMVIRRILAGTYVLSESAYHDYFERASALRSRVSEELRRCLAGGVACIIGPTSPVLPYSISNPPSFADTLANDFMTVPANLAGLPAVSVPAGVVNCDRGKDGRVPVGMQLIGGRLQEGELLRVALAIEQRCGFLGSTTLPL